jgi:hypothetical protein
MSLKQEKHEWELPHLKESHRFPVSYIPVYNPSPSNFFINNVCCRKYLAVCITFSTNLFS